MDERTVGDAARQTATYPTGSPGSRYGNREQERRSQPAVTPEAAPSPARPVAFRTAPGGESPWTTVFGLTTGVTMLANGTAREIDIDDDRLEILELDEKGLGAMQNGRVDETAASLDTGRYDADGRPITRLVAELHGVEGFSPAMTAAALHRDGQWFADDILVRELLDGVRVFTIRSAGLDDVPRTAAVSAGPAGPDSLHVRYTASVREYQGEALVRDAVLDQTWDLEAAARNRTGTAVGHRFSVAITTRDAGGRPVRSVSCHNTLEASGSERERLSATWYDGGRPSAAISGECVLGTGNWRTSDALAWRLSPAGLGACAWDRQGFPAAGDCLAGVFLPASRDGGLFLAPLWEALVAGLCDPLGAVTGDVPYELSWCRRRFEAGKPVARREDTAWRRRPEPAGPGSSLLAGASHTEERFWNGLCVSRHRLELAEVPHAGGLATTCVATAGLGEQPRPVTRLVPGGLAGADPESEVAVVSLSREAAAIKAEIGSLLGRLITAER